MLEASYLFIDAKSKTAPEQDDFIPRLHDVRRVGLRYQRMLPLSVIKEHQCVVLGATTHMLTVGVIERKNKQWLHSIEAMTGTAIFPVLVKPERMRLLIVRLERHQRFRQRRSRASYLLFLPWQVRHFLLLRESERI